jgi:hypothetical protein
MLVAGLSTNSASVDGQKLGRVARHFFALRNALSFIGDEDLGGFMLMFFVKSDR